MLKIYEEEVGDDNVIQTCISGTCRLEVDEEGTATLITDDGDRYVENYGWDDDDDGDTDNSDDDDDGGGGNGGGGGLKTAAALAGAAAVAEIARRAAERGSTPPARPAPGHEETKQRPLKRERYG